MQGADTVTGNDFHGPATLRDLLGSQFVHDVVLRTGQQSPSISATGSCP